MPNVRRRSGLMDGVGRGDLGGSVANANTKRQPAVTQAKEIKNSSAGSPRPQQYAKIRGAVSG